MRTEYYSSIVYNSFISISLLNDPIVYNSFISISLINDYGTKLLIYQINHVKTILQTTIYNIKTTD